VSTFDSPLLPCTFFPWEGFPSFKRRFGCAFYVLCSQDTHFPFLCKARIECRQNLEGGKNGKDEAIARNRARMFGTAIILVSLAFTFSCFSHSQTGSGMVKISKTFMSNFLISGLVCAQIVLAEKASETRRLLRSPSNTEYGTKAFGVLSRILRQGRNPSARPSLCATKRWINRHIITIPIFCLLLLTLYDLPPLWNVH